MKKLLLPLFLLIVSIASAQKIIKTEKVTDHSTHVIGNNFEGVIFTKDYELRSYTNKKNQEFTPAFNEIELAEKLLHTNLDTVNNKWAHIIHKKLRKYLRQYFGYINKKGERIIYINAFSKKTRHSFGEQWLKDLIIVEDGGDNYWQVEINLNTMQLFSFSINSVA